jgi:hypothetical protein
MSYWGFLPTLVNYKCCLQCTYQFVQISRPPLVIGVSRTLLVIVCNIPDFGRAALIADAIIDVHSFSVKVQAANRYLSFAAILECKACHASSFGSLPFRIFAPHSIADVRISWIIFVLLPFGAIQIPSISDAVLHDNRFSETKLLSSVFAIKSNSNGEFVATHFPRYHTNSTRCQYILSDTSASPV